MNTLLVIGTFAFHLIYTSYVGNIFDHFWILGSNTFCLFVFFKRFDRVCRARESNAQQTKTQNGFGCARNRKESGSRPTYSECTTKLVASLCCVLFWDCAVVSRKKLGAHGLVF